MMLSRKKFLQLLVAGVSTTTLAACGARASNRQLAARPTSTLHDTVGADQAALTEPAAPMSRPASITTAMPTVTDSPLPTRTPVPTHTPIPTDTPEPTSTLAPTDRPVPTSTPDPTATSAPTRTPRPTATATPTAKPQLAARTAGRQMWVWLRMLGGQEVPSSEADYAAHMTSIDAALPLNGGKLQGDGSWLQEDTKLRPAWPRNLRERARKAGQLYMPGMGNDPEGLLAVVNNPGIHGKVAEELVGLATANRFDAPWDGVYLDLEAIDAEHRAGMTVLLRNLGRAVKDAGLLLGISVGGTVVDDKPVTDPAFDLGVLRELADFVDLRCYDYWAPPPRSIGPYWWMEGVVKYALRAGLPAHKITMGQANYSRYWPNSYGGASREMTYGQALAFIQENGANLEWLEANEYGPVRERIARIGNGHVIVHDGDTYQHGLNIIDQYGLLGSTIFAPGMGDDRHWQVIKAWKRA